MQWHTAGPDGELVGTVDGVEAQDFVLYLQVNVLTAHVFLLLHIV